MNLQLFVKLKIFTEIWSYKKIRVVSSLRNPKSVFNFNSLQVSINEMKQGGNATQINHDFYQLNKPTFKCDFKLHILGDEKLCKSGFN